jgi:hypothetical protein
MKGADIEAASAGSQVKAASIESPAHSSFASGHPYSGNESRISERERRVI